jgi:hypothetical protein
MSAWARCRDWLVPAMTDTSEAETLADLMAGRAQLWPGDTAAGVSRIEDAREGRCIHVWLAGGALEGVLALRPGVEAYGRAWGCTEITINGRRGWDRALRPFGYVRSQGELRKGL